MLNKQYFPTMFPFISVLLFICWRLCGLFLGAIDLFLKKDLGAIERVIKKVYRIGKMWKKRFKVVTKSDTVPMTYGGL